MLAFDVPSQISGAVNVDIRLAVPPFSKIANTLTTTTSGRRKVSFIVSSNASVILYFQTQKVHYPQLETGDTATAFEASTSETTSQIKQTADQINMSIRQDLEETGIKIDGNNKEINLLANKAKFSTSAGVPMIAVQMCDANGNVGTGAAYTIPSIVFYNGEIGAQGVSVQWVLNYLGFIQATNAGKRYEFKEVYNILRFEAPSGEKYEHEGEDATYDISIYTLASRRFSNNQLIEVMYNFYSGYYVNDGGQKVYQPAQGIYYQCFNAQEDLLRYWLTKSVNNTFVPDKAAASGYYFMESRVFNDSSQDVPQGFVWPDESDYQSGNRAGDVGDGPVLADRHVCVVYSLVYFEPSDDTDITTNPEGLMNVVEECFGVFYRLRNTSGNVWVLSGSTGCIMVSAVPVKDEFDDVDWTNTLNIQDILDAQ